MVLVCQHELGMDDQLIEEKKYLLIIVGEIIKELDQIFGNSDRIEVNRSCDRVE